MEERRTLCDPAGYVVKNRSSSGCLIVRKKGGDGVIGTGSSSSFSRKVFDLRTENKRFRTELSDSTSSDEPLTSPRGRMGSESVGVCNGLSDFMKGVMEGSRIVRKRSREEGFGGNEGGLITRNREQVNERQGCGNVAEFDELDCRYADGVRKNCLDDGVIEGRSLSMMGMNGLEREHDIGFRRHVDGLDRRKRSYIDNSTKFSRGEYVERDGNHQPLSYLMANCGSNGIIRVQGKNGVLRVMVNKKKKVDGSFGTNKHLETVDRGQGSRLDCSAKANNVVLHPHCSEQKTFAKCSSSVRTDKKTNLAIPSSAGKENFDDDDDDSEDSGASMKLGLKSLESRMKTPMSTKKTNSHSMDLEDSDTSLKLSAKAVEAHKSVKGPTSGGVEKTLSDQVLPNKSKEGKVKRGSGTKKQKLREQIREMLLESGWTIDYRPRKNRDYLDAVYINPSGTAYWSIIKAYEALLKQLNDMETEARSRSKDSLFKPLPDEVLSQLTRKTKKKIEKQMKLKQTDVNGSENDRDIRGSKFQKARDDRDSTDSGSHEEKLSSFVKQGGKSLKNRCDANDSASVSSKDYEDLYVDIEKPSSMSACHQERKSTKLGRCTLVVRDADGGPGSDNNGFVPYSGKRTLLSWLIDCGTVQLRQKVRYMNRKRTKVMLEGWITRDGIHCGCCSKILTVSKFEIHAGSKLHQPFQNIYVDSGASLLECQIDAWNSQESIQHTGYYSVDVDCDDPSDDTCGRCGDGGDLICCDGCPSTFHLSCLDMEMLPPGDWHCPNCTCKFCGLASKSTIQGDDTTDSTLLVCGLCAKRYHESCTQGIDDLSLDANNLTFLFCEKKCKQLFEQLLKNLGVKHELDSGYLWSIIHRTDIDSDTSIQGFQRMVESNSKLAIALSVMDECFFPIVDRKSGINLVNNVVYNCGSNLSRLNFFGFFTMILERGDEIISAASIRFHGTRLAEMPFIGTRHMYRHQGMCHRLFGAIELALSSLKVERLIVPAVAGFTNTWTNVFGFTSLEEQIKHELKSTNILVFPGIDMLRKDLLKQEKVDGKITIGTGKLKEPKCITPEMTNKPEINPSGRKVPDESDNKDLENSRETSNEIDRKSLGSD